MNYVNIINFYKDTFKSPDISLYSLILANLVPIFGVFYFDWDAGFIIVIYWSENIIIGAFNVLKMASFHVEHPVENFGKLPLIAFFLVHYGGFCAVHGVFVMVLTQGTKGFGSDLAGLNPSWWGPLIFVQLLFQVIGIVIGIAGRQLVFPAIALVLSHGISFFQNFIFKGEYKKLNGKDLMAAPYKRIIIMHIAILLGAAPVLLLKSPLPLLILLVIMKIILDITLHVKEHRKSKLKQSSKYEEQQKISLGV